MTVHPATWGSAQPDLTYVQRHLWPGGGYLGSASTWPHTPGALAEQLVVRRDQVRRLPASLPVKRAALAEPLAVGLHGLAISGGIRGKRVLISGSGPIGLLAAAAAAAEGAAEVVCADLLPGPLERARALGEASPVPIGTVQIGVEDLPDSYFDVTLECAGVPRRSTDCCWPPAGPASSSRSAICPTRLDRSTWRPWCRRRSSCGAPFASMTEIDAAIALLDQEPADRASDHSRTAD